jgi:hypothetical protein
VGEEDLVSEPERHSIKGWGKKLSLEAEESMTREDALLLATMSAADRLTELLTVMQTIGDRLHRLEVYVEENVPGYTYTSAYRPSPAASDPTEVYQRIAVQGPSHGAR